MFQKNCVRSFGFAYILMILEIMSVSGFAQHRKATIDIPLTINKEYDQPMMVSIIDFETEPPIQTRFPQGKNLKVGMAPGKVLVLAQKLTDSVNSYSISVDSDNDADLEDEIPQVILPDSSIKVSLNRKWQNDEEKTLPYIITYRRYASNNNVHELFSWRPHYRAEGTLKFNNCEKFFAVLDLNGDGKFDRKDFGNGTTIGIDQNEDGRIWGKDEWMKGEQIIPVCGENFLVDLIESDGSKISLIQTNLQIPIVGRQVPSFSMKTMEGQTISSQDLLGKTVLLDFWASWCKPCVEKFPFLQNLEKKFEDKIHIFAINVDYSQRLDDARQIIKKYNLKWPQVLEGKGESDPLWKMFGSIGENRLSIPLYVLIDEKGTLRYADYGGEQLSGLSHSLSELFSNHASVGKQ